MKSSTKAFVCFVVAALIAVAGLKQDSTSVSSYVSDTIARVYAATSLSQALQEAKKAVS